MTELLKLEHVSYRYEESFPALRDVSVSFHAGERVAVLGNNGAGKSTFFLCCNGVLRPQEGEMFLKGSPLSGSKADTIAQRRAIGLVFQEPDTQIIAGTVESEVSFGPMNLRLGETEVEQRVGEALENMGLADYRDRAPQYLSGGEKKRVSIADILAMKPEMILFDEPTASLDPCNVAILENTLDELSAAGISIAVSTHDVDFAYRFASRAIVFSAGEIIADDAIEKVFASEVTLEQAGLKKPLLYAAAESLDSLFSLSFEQEKPRTIEEFEHYLKRLHDGRLNAPAASKATFLLIDQ